MNSRSMNRRSVNIEPVNLVFLFHSILLESIEFENELDYYFGEFGVTGQWHPFNVKDKEKKNF